MATWFGCGLFPWGPGTVGSVAALVVAWPLASYFGWPAWWFAVLALILLGPAIWAADVTAKTIDRKDPGLVVVDEVVGQWITVAAAGALHWKSWVLALLLFRIFDIWKPWPARSLERLAGGLGIVADDVAAGVYGAVVLFMLRKSQLI